MENAVTSNPSGWWGLAVGLVALGWNIVNALVERRPKIAIRQAGDSVTDRAHTQPDGRVIYMLRVVISNESTKKSVVLAYFRLLLPWNDETLDLLPDPKEIEKDKYIIPGSPNSLWRYDRDMILNHRVDGEGRLGPGEVMDGALLFNGLEPIPNDIPNGSEIEVKLQVILHHGRSFSEKCRMLVDKGRTVYENQARNLTS